MSQPLSKFTIVQNFLGQYMLVPLFFNFYHQQRVNYYDYFFNPQKSLKPWKVRARSELWSKLNLSQNIYLQILSWICSMCTTLVTKKNCKLVLHKYNLNAWMPSIEIFCIFYGAVLKLNQVKVWKNQGKLIRMRFWLFSWVGR